MRYTTTACRNCGYRTRNHEANVPSVELGLPIDTCPKCGNLMLDSIATEYEFMSKYERKKFTSRHLKNKCTYIVIFYSILSAVWLASCFFICSLMGGFHFAVIVPILLFAYALFAVITSILNYRKTVKEKLLEQAVYASLKRTSNANYVKFLETLYEKNRIKRRFSPLDNSSDFLEKNKELENNQTYKKLMEDFEILSELIEAVDELTSLE